MVWPRPLIRRNLASMASIEVVYVAATAPAHGTGQAQAACPAGKLLTGGGFDLGSLPYSRRMHVRRSRDYNDGTVDYWQVIVENENDTDYSFAAIAYCLTQP